ncbi:MAG: crossover junction endodeoxyribonuclease RuvC [Dietzia sp.]|jgi:crossover junction endodeoxyribonuclease RuvC|uniref:Crossover junction endodeoxyribonuclease RuvC n=7 Tax=Dietzia TaxID=37914 RepID=A0ABN2I0N6_9ACTN|nr:MULTISPECIES: crossover junction endodeoxyribonuclease RuvC [Dietzia]MCT1513890.1 crossover junction endodeoxyribonuclease RuvC [Dietzia cercidiphylli]MDO8392766.1 crossover junction endodeoxyribonuclease RuvC [Dietzia sp.]
MRVMGVDPGLTRCGLALIETAPGRAVTALDVDVVRTSADEPLERRLRAVHEVADEWMAVHRPDVVAIERVFAQNQVSTAMGTAQAAGVVAMAAAYRDIPVAFHTPSEVKAAVTGSGRADKKQMTLMITRILGLQKPPSPADAADALALAVCHSWRAPMQGRVAALDAQVSRSRAGFQAKVVKGRAAAATEAADAGRARGGTGSADQERARAAARAMARTKGVRW